MVSRDNREEVSARHILDNAHFKTFKCYILQIETFCPIHQIFLKIYVST